MRKVVITYYMAEDGTYFNSATECKQYERKEKEIKDNGNALEDITLYTYKGIVRPTTMTELGEWVGFSDMVKIDSPTALNLTVNALDVLGLVSSGLVDCGTYVFDTKKRHWFEKE
jgi:hypothetical protein